MQVDNKKFYKASLKKYGATAQGLHWSSSQTQQIRFMQLMQLLPESMEHYSMIDAGCGFADFYLFLQEKGRKPLCYTGVDCMEEMVKEARKRTPCTILKRNILTDRLIPADFYCCSGAMNTLAPFETQLFIRRCYDAATYGFVFNILHGVREDRIYNYVQREAVEAIAAALNATCRIVTGYLDRDMSVALYKRDIL